MDADTPITNTIQGIILGIRLFLPGIAYELAEAGARAIQAIELLFLTNPERMAVERSILKAELEAGKIPTLFERVAKPE
jgi:hypothetical protein